MLASSRAVLRDPFDRHSSIGSVVEAIEKLRIDLADSRDHFADHRARFARRVATRRDMRHRRCSTMPESVCTMVVNAATGRT